MTKFNKTEEELVTRFEKWLFLLKNLHRFQEVPVVLQEKIFRKAFKIAEVAKLNKQDIEQYQASLKYKRDWKNTLDYAVEEAAEKGIEKGDGKSSKGHEAEALQPERNIRVNRLVSGEDQEPLVPEEQ